MRRGDKSIGGCRMQVDAQEYIKRDKKNTENVMMSSRK
jgi:hypothetical protein